MREMIPEDFARKHGVELDWTANGYQRDDTGWEYQSFTVTLEHEGRSESFDWRQGLGITDEPSIGSVLPSLVLDFMSAGQSFEDWCSDYGYDTDSLRAYRTWQAVDEQAGKIRRLFGDDWSVLDDFAEVEES